MSITLTSAGTTVTLPEDLFWSDEFAWLAPETNVSRSVTGALIVQKGTKTKGRPITLQPPDELGAWLSRADLEQVRAWAAADAALSLNLRGVARSVQFRYNEVAIDARPIVHFNDTDPGDKYLVTLRFMEI